MAKLKIYTDSGFSIDSYDFSDLFYASSYKATSTSFRATYGDGSADYFRGNGFEYSDEGVPTDGTVTSYLSYRRGELIASISGGKVEATTIVKAAQTSSTSDDFRIFKNVLSGKDTFDGGGGVDVISTYNGNDTLNGRGGRDVLSGGSGKDTFVFTARLGFDSVDTITDFSHKDDTFALSRSIFKDIGKGEVSSKEFHEVTSPFSAKVDASDRILYDRKDGDLFYDRDGSGDRYDPIKFADVKNKLTLNHTDFLIV